MKKIIGSGLATFLLSLFPGISYANLPSIMAQTIEFGGVVARTATAMQAETIILLPTFARALETAGVASPNSGLFVGPVTKTPYAFFSEMHGVISEQDAARALATMTSDEHDVIFDKHSAALIDAPIARSLEGGTLKGVASDKEFQEGLEKFDTPLEQARYLVVQIAMIKMDLVRLGLAQLDEEGNLVLATNELAFRNDSYTEFLRRRLTTCAEQLKAITSTPDLQNTLTIQGIRSLAKTGRNEGFMIDQFLVTLTEDTTARVIMD